MAGPTASVTLDTSTGTGNFPSYGGKVGVGAQPLGYVVVNLNDPSKGLSASNENAGGIGASINPLPVGDGSLNLLWCTDLFDSITYGENATYNVGTLFDTGSGITFPTIDTTRVNQISALLYNSEVNPTGNINLLNSLAAGSTAQSVMSAAVQLAIWTILYDGIDSGYNITSSTQNFYVSSGQTGNAASAISTAATLLGCVTGIVNATYCTTAWAANGSYTVVNLDAGISGGTTVQSLAYLNAVPVPEPSSLAILGASLVGLAMLRRRPQCPATKRSSQ